MWQRWGSRKARAHLGTERRSPWLRREVGCVGHLGGWGRRLQGHGEAGILPPSTAPWPGSPLRPPLAATMQGRGTGEAAVRRETTGSPLQWSRGEMAAWPGCRGDRGGLEVPQQAGLADGWRFFLEPHVGLAVALVGRERY